MFHYRDHLPQLESKIFLMDGGMETDLIFQRGIDVPHFAVFDLLSISSGRQTLHAYYIPYIELAKQQQRGFILESPTWRANPDWGARLGYGPDALRAANVEAIKLLQKLRDEYQTPKCPLVISGCIGPRGDGYVVAAKMTVEQARDYHAFQINTFADTAADFVSVLTLNYVEEAIGATLAAIDAQMPIVISFTTETDGRLPSGMTLKDAILQVDAASGSYPSYYMINCAHPQHFTPALEVDAEWVKRIRALRANASCKSHAELDESTTLDRGDPTQLGHSYQELRKVFPSLTVLGGCCGTDIEHVRAISRAC